MIVLIVCQMISACYEFLPALQAATSFVRFQGQALSHPLDWFVPPPQVAQ